MTCCRLRFMYLLRQKMSKKELFLIISLFIFSFLIRVIGLNKYPPGFYTDEAAVGYSAYSILKTGRDEFGNLLPLAFKSFIDFKAPVYIYSVVPSIFLFGLNEFSVRLPSAIISALAVLVVYLLAKELTKKSEKKIKDYFPILTAFLISITPWHFTFSRIAFEGNMSLFFVALGIYLFLLSLGNGWFFTPSLVSFSLSIYSYHSARLTTPFLILGLIYIYRKPIFEKIKSFLIACFLALIFSIPLIYATLKNFDDIVKRPANISIFKDKGVEGKLWEAQVFDAGQPVILTRILHNKPYYYLLSFLRNYFKHFEGGYLFLYGDLGEHFRVPNSGGLYLVSLPFLILGIMNLIKNKEKERGVIFLWLLLSPIAAALTFMVPSGHRNLNAITPFSMIATYGILTWTKTEKRRIFVFLIFLANVIYFSYQYLVIAPMTMAKDWNYGYKQVIGFIKKIENNYDKIILTNDSGETYMHYLFFSKYPPEIYQKEANFDEIDKFGIGHVYKVDKYEFRMIDWKKEKKEPRVLWVGTVSEIPDNESHLNYLKTFFYPNGEKAFLAVELNLKKE